jgi:hypothetical protein
LSRGSVGLDPLVTGSSAPAFANFHTYELPVIFSHEKLNYELRLLLMFIDIGEYSCKQVLDWVFRDCLLVKFMINLLVLINILQYLKASFRLFMKSDIFGKSHVHCPPYRNFFTNFGIISFFFELIHG